MNKKLPTLDEELVLWGKGYHVVGIDEVGRGAFAGPLVAGAVVYSPHFQQNLRCTNLLVGVRDSKLLPSEKREALAPCIRNTALFYATAEVSARVINKIGIVEANQIVFRKVIHRVQEQMSGEKLFLLVDGFHAKYVRGIGLRNQKAIVKGDQKCFSIAAASIIAKVYRDHFMSELGSDYRKYDFAKHKGYGTKLHQEKLKKFGLSPLHRTVFCHNFVS